MTRSNGNSNDIVDGAPEPTTAGLAVNLSDSRTAPPAPANPRLGEELPIFCEKCGYSLNGLSQIRCDRCRVLHFACPECDHHQPINTLRPAAQRILGRLRALGLALIVFLKIMFFGWTLFFWGVSGFAMSYGYIYSGPRGGTWGPAEFEWEGGLAYTLFGAAFGMIGRMLLLRWRRGVLVGLVLAGLAVLAMAAGAELRRLDYHQPIPSPFEAGFLMYMTWAFIGVWCGAAMVWGIWLALATAFLPKRAATSLLAWQTAMSSPKGEPDRTDSAVSVTA